MKVRGNFYFLVIIMVSMLVIIGLSVQMETIKSKLLPLLMGSIAFVLAAIELWRETLGKDESATTATAIDVIKNEEARRGLREYLGKLGWVIGFSLAIYLLGFITSIPLFVLAYMKSHGIGWRVAIICAVVAIAAIYGVFEFALRVELYRGLLFTWLGQLFT
ncbi:MAG: tripartite tricarboxylate transporter TctB family protein [Chloroflexi bacterium]|nr:tripartite tricarboxylate transporter TctB family protein [Chloroflexota bacterium]